MTDAAVRCPLCSAECRPWFAKADRHLTRCSGCGLIVVPEGLARTADGRSIYEDDDNIFLQDGNEAYYLDPTNFTAARSKRDWVRGFLPPGSTLLDAGANFGHFLAEAKSDWRCVGMELSPQAVRWSRDNLQVDNHVGSVYDPPAPLVGPYDAVTCWDVIEHLEDPPSALAALRKLVRPGGLLFLSTPDAGARVAKLLGRRWHYLDPVQHLCVFDRRNLSSALERAGFEVVGSAVFGRHYRIRYVMDRLLQLNPGGPGGLFLRSLRALAGPLGDAEVYIQLGDVMGLAARRRD